MGRADRKDTVTETKYQGSMQHELSMTAKALQQAPQAAGLTPLTGCRRVITGIASQATEEQGLRGQDRVSTHLVIHRISAVAGVERSRCSPVHEDWHRILEVHQKL